MILVFFLSCTFAKLRHPTHAHIIIPFHFIIHLLIYSIASHFNSNKYDITSYCKVSITNYYGRYFKNCDVIMQITELQQYHLFDTNFNFVGCKMANNAHTHTQGHRMNELSRKKNCEKRRCCA